MATLDYRGEHGLLPAEGNKGVDDPDQSPAWFYQLPPYLGYDKVDDSFTVFQCPGICVVRATLFYQRVAKVTK